MKKEKVIDYKNEHQHKAQCPSPLLIASTPRLVTAARRTEASPDLTLPNTTLSPPPSQPLITASATPTTPPPTDLQAENISLKERLATIQEQMKILLDHSIESDQRLLQYTNEIFTSKTLNLQTSDQSVQTTLPNDSVIKSQENTIKSLTNTISQLEKNLETSENKIKNLEIKFQENFLSSRKCTILKEEASKMISTIRILEYEIKSLKINSPAGFPSEHVDFIPLKNKFEVLSDSCDEKPEPYFTMVSRKPAKLKSKVKQQKYKNQVSSKGSSKILNNNIVHHKTPFRNVTVIGDSHARHIAALTGDRTHHLTKVTGLCKPSAGLLSIAPSTTTPPPPENCYVLLAGANDVDAGKQSIIYSRLEGILQDCCKTSRVILLSLPYRHDLPPTSPIHATVTLVNNVMAELCRRHDGVEFLDITSIARRHFTRHGLHLRISGKRLLADLIAERLALMNPLSRPPQPEPKMTSQPRSHTLSHETYAKAVTANATCQPAQHRENSTNNVNSSLGFLGTPLPALRLTTK